jgi:hypothetical protein
MTLSAFTPDRTIPAPKAAFRKRPATARSTGFFMRPAECTLRASMPPPTAMPLGSPAESVQAILALSAPPHPADTPGMPSSDSLMGFGATVMGRSGSPHTANQSRAMVSPPASPIPVTAPTFGFP